MDFLCDLDPTTQRPIQITMIANDVPTELFLKSLYDMILRGNPGSRITIADKVVGNKKHWILKKRLT